MSMAGLLNRFGHDAGRWVTPEGLVGIGPSASAEPGFRIAPHTFHGGDDPVDHPAASSEDSTPWWMHADETRRERQAMAAAFPGFIELPGDERTPHGWAGSITTGRGTFPVLLQHRQDHGLPMVVPLRITRRGKPRGRGWAKAPHLYLSGNLCVADDSDWDPNKYTTADVVAWTAHWHACYVEWLATDLWPTEGIPDVAA